MAGAVARGCPESRSLDGRHPRTTGAYRYPPRVRIGKLIINMLALVAASVLVPGFKLNLKADNGLVYLILLALIFGLINTFIRPIARILSFPITLITLGLFTFVVNAAMLLLLAWVAGQVQHDPYALRLGGFPPKFDPVNTLVAAAAGSIVISVVSTVVAWFIPER
jgi:putative membrane protein